MNRLTLMLVVAPILYTPAFGCSNWNGEIEGRGAKRAAVVGGNVAAAGRWPDAAGLAYAGGVIACGGTLIDAQLVVTAKHCLWSEPEAVALATQDLNDPGEIIEIAGAWQAPDGYDAAMLWLARPASVAPRAVGRGRALETLAAGSSVTVVGYGAIDRAGTRWGNQLREARTGVVDPVCADLRAGCRSDVPEGTELIAGGAGVDACRGDSGGPLYFEADDGSDYLLGIAARGIESERDVCGDGGIYVRADALAAVFEAETGFHLPGTGAGDAPRALTGGCSASANVSPPSRLPVAILFALAWLLWQRAAHRRRAERRKRKNMTRPARTGAPRPLSPPLLEAVRGGGAQVGNRQTRIGRLNR